MTRQKITIITDIDGIFTDPVLSFDKSLQKTKHFSVNDSLTARLLQSQFADKFELLALTGDKGDGLAISADRMNYMGIKFQHCRNDLKYHWIKDNYDISKIIYIGDDIFDVPTFQECRMACTVTTAPKVLKDLAWYISPYSGGQSGFTDIISTIVDYFYGSQAFKTSIINHVMSESNIEDYNKQFKSPTV